MREILGKGLLQTQSLKFLHTVNYTPGIKKIVPHNVNKLCLPTEQFPTKILIIVIVCSHVLTKTYDFWC